MDRKDEFSALRKKSLSDLELELQLVPGVVEVDDSQKSRAQLLKLKVIWREYSRACASLKSIHILSDDDSSALRVRNEKKSMGARVSSAILDLNEHLGRCGQDLESLLSESTASSISARFLEGLDIQVEMEDQISTASVPLNPDDSPETQAGVASGVFQHTRTRAIVPSESTMRAAMLDASKELNRWLVVIRTAENLDKDVASIYLTEVEKCFKSFKSMAILLADYHRRSGEMESSHKVREAIAQNVLLCDRAVEKLKSYLPQTERESTPTEVTKPLDSLGSDKRRVTFDVTSVLAGKSSNYFSGFRTSSNNFTGEDCQLVGNSLALDIDRETTPNVELQKHSLSSPTRQSVQSASADISTKLIFSNSPNVVLSPREPEYPNRALTSNKSTFLVSPEKLNHLNLHSTPLHLFRESSADSGRDRSKSQNNAQSPLLDCLDSQVSSSSFSNLYAREDSGDVCTWACGLRTRISGHEPVGSMSYHDRDCYKGGAVTEPCSLASGYSRNRPLSSYMNSQANTSADLGAFVNSSAHEVNSQLAASFRLQSRLQLQKELRKGLGEPFGGRPELYRSWRNKLLENLENADCTASMSMDILLNNTTGHPKRIVTQLYHSELDAEEQVRQVWARFQSRYGSHTTIFRSYLDQLHTFPKITSPSNIEKMEDLLILCHSLAASSLQSAGLTFLRSAEGLSTIWEKMPDEFIGKWRDKCGYYRRIGSEADIHVFLNFMSEYIDNRAQFQPNPIYNMTKPSRNHSAFRTELVESSSDQDDYCLYHKLSSHKFDDCKVFDKLTHKSKMKWVFQEKRCYVCFNVGHQAKDCTDHRGCTECGGRHHHRLHPPSPREPREDTRNFCSVICGSSSAPVRTCSKTVPVQVRVSGGSETITCYCIIDEQSNSSFCHPTLVENLNIDATDGAYTLSTMAGLKSYVKGSSVGGLEVKALGQGEWISLPQVWTHPFLPDTTSEVATRKVVAAHPHLQSLAHNFPREKLDCEVLLLIGHNCGEAMRTQQHGEHFPFAHHTALGWALVGPACVPGDFPGTRCLRTAIVCEHYKAERVPINLETPRYAHQDYNTFAKLKEDELPGLSQEDQNFIKIVSGNVILNSTGNLEIPLPLKENVVFPKNERSVFFRTKNALLRICKRPNLREQCQNVMAKYIESGHVSELSRVEASRGDPTNYIPVFPVENARKKKVRIVFDSAASFQGVSLNDLMLRGPDVTNLLLGVLLRFRNGGIGFAADIETMFHCFHVTPEHRKLLRFFWWKGNTPGNEYSTYQANVHVFGNCCSPAIATFGLRHAAALFSTDETQSSKDFIDNNFYVDDGLAARNSSSEAIQVLEGARQILSKANIHLHKIMSSSSEVLAAFPPSELAQGIEEREVFSSTPQTALGLIWTASSDELGLRVRVPTRDFSKRGILSIINSVFDPVGLVSPIVLGGRLLQRFIIAPQNMPSAYHGYDWDDPLPVDLQPQWDAWRLQLDELSSVKVPRSYAGNSSNIVSSEIHMFCDASRDAIGFVAYLRQTGWGEDVHVSFLLASSKVAPRAATSIPRLELCAAVEGARASFLLERELRMSNLRIFLYSDSQVVLGYLRNTTKAFSQYVTARVSVILHHSPIEQWNYIPGQMNPADIATRPHTVHDLLKSVWLQGPDFLKSPEAPCFTVTNVTSDLPETVPVKLCMQTSALSETDGLTRLLDSHLSYKSMIAILSKVITFTKRCRKMDIEVSDIENTAIVFICRVAQREAFGDECGLLKKGRPLSGSSTISSLAPFLDSSGVIRVGGRLSNSTLPYHEKHPVLLPSGHAITLVILKHFHELCFHQGRVLTTASLRSGGFHILKQKSTVTKFLNNCTMCRRMRAVAPTQRMSDLPSDRLERTPPFEFSGVDVCGPYLVYEGRATRRTTGSKKVWIILFTCLYSRAIHTDLLISLDAATFQLALRRFVSLRGNCKLFRSDCGSNFVGLQNQMNIQKIISSTPDEFYSWKFLPPKASHFAGVWERKIGAIKRVLDSSIILLGKSALSRDEFHTLLQEASAIVNSTPLGEISSDPNDPYPVSPSHLLTLRQDDGSRTAPPTSADDLLSYGKKRWRRVQYLADQFWVRWKRDYLRSINIRRKWKDVKPNVEVGDVVLLRDKSPRCSWPLGIVVSAKPGRDGLVRTLEIRCKSKVFSRSISDVVILTRTR